MKQRPEIRIEADDDRFEPLMKLARALMDEARRLADDTSLPDCEEGQAFHYAATALLNATEFEGPDGAAAALGAVLGAISAEVRVHFNDDTFMTIALEQAATTEAEVLERHQGAAG